MSLLVNLKHLERREQRLQGELPPGELALDTRDEMMQVNGSVRYDLVIQRLEHGLLGQGRLTLTLHCQCVRCLKPFDYPLTIENWTCHIPLSGEDQAVVNNDCVDLTPYLREDIFLAFPQHPLCAAACGGLDSPLLKTSEGPDPESAPPSPVWSELDKLRL